MCKLADGIGRFYFYKVKNVIIINKEYDQDTIAKEVVIEFKDGSSTSITCFTKTSRAIDLFK